MSYSPQVKVHRSLFKCFENIIHFKAGVYTDILVRLLTRPCIALPLISLPICAQHTNIYGLGSVLKLWKYFGFEICVQKFRGVEIMTMDDVLWAIFYLLISLT